MAEPVGLVIGGLSLASLFTNCIECMNLVRSGQNLSKDYQLSITQLILLEARLKAWGNSLSVTTAGNEHPTLRNNWNEEQGAVGRCLVSIKELFQDSKDLERKYGLREIETENRTLVFASSQQSPAFQEIEDRLRYDRNTQQSTLPAWKKSTWAIRDKKRFDSLLSLLDSLISGLEQLSDRLKVIGLQRELLSLKIQSISRPESINLLEEASSQAEEPRASQNASRASGHTYIRNICKDQARMMQGDVDVHEQGSYFHRYEDNTASGNSRLMQGNMSREAAADFWR
ncbi:MAG: hypothetical protein Q9167_000799 [Letrouitia subvulpina]